MRVLIVDDERFLVRALMRVLRVAHTVDGAHTTHEALAHLERAHVHAVLVDRGLQFGADGVELLRQIRARWPGVRRVLMSGTEPPDLSDLLATEVAHCFLPKPAAEEAVFAALGERPPG